MTATITDVRPTGFFTGTLAEREPEITGWIRATLDDYRLVQQAGLRETGILTSISD